MKTIKLSQIDNFQRLICYGSKCEATVAERLLMDIYGGRRFKKSYINIDGEIYLIEKDLTKNDIEKVLYCDAYNCDFVTTDLTTHECPNHKNKEWDLVYGYVIKGRKPDKYEPKVLKQIEEYYKNQNHKSI